MQLRHKGEPHKDVHVHICGICSLGTRTGVAAMLSFAESSSLFGVCCTTDQKTGRKRPFRSVNSENMECVTETIPSLINYEPGTPVWEACTGSKQTTGGGTVVSADRAVTHLGATPTHPHTRTHACMHAHTGSSWRPHRQTLEPKQ